MKQNQSHQMTDLHVACAKGDIEQVKTLLKQGMEADTLNQNFQPPAFNALMLPIMHDDDLVSRKQSIFDLLRKNAPDSIKLQDISGETILHIMAVHGYDTLLKNVMEQHPKLNTQQNNHGRYPIHAAILNGQTKAAQVLLAGDPQTITQTDSRGQSALHYAALYGSEEIFKLCYSFDKNTNKTDQSGNTPFILAAKANNTEVLAFLNQQPDLDCHAVNAEGQNALHAALHNQQSQAALWLAEHTDIDVNLKDQYEKTPLELAKEFDNSLYEAIQKNS